MTPSWLRQLFKKRFVGQGSVAPIRHRLVVETLEDRVTPASVITWNGNDVAASGGTALNWSDGMNWDLGRAPQAGDDVVFPTGLVAANKPPASGAGVTFQFAANSVVDKNFTIQSLTINDDNYHIDATGGAATLTITQGLFFNIPNAVGPNTGLSILGPIFSPTVTTSNLTLRLVGSPTPGTETDPEISNRGTGVIYITATLAESGGSAGFVINPQSGQNGTIVLGGSNSYSGTSEVKRGTLIVTSDGALGSTAKSTIVDTGATLGVAGGRILDHITISGTGTSNNGALDGVADPLNIFTFNNPNSGGGTVVGGVSLNGDASIGADTHQTDLTIDTSGIDGSGNLTKVGNGNLNLRVADAYTGNTLINQGSVSIFDENALSPGFQTTVKNGATLRLANNLNVDEVLFLNGNGDTFYTDTLGRPAGALSLFNAGKSTWLGPITVAGNPSIGAVANGLLLLAGDLRGSSVLSKVDQGDVRIERANSNFTGTTVVNNGTLQLADPLGLGTGSITVNANTPSASFGTLQLEGNYSLTNPLVLNGLGYHTNGAVHVVQQANGNTSSINLTSGFVLNVTSNLNVDPNQTLTVSGVIGDVPANAPSLEKIGGGKLILTGDNTYTGSTVLRGGTTVLRSNTALGVGGANSGTSILTGALLSLEGTAMQGLNIANESLTITGSTGVPTRSELNSAIGTNIWGGPIGVISNGADVAIGADSGASLELTNTISGTSDIHKVGAGILKFTGMTNNVNSGTLYVDGGTLVLGKTGGAQATGGNIVIGDAFSAPGSEILRLDAADQIPDNRNVTVNASGLFNLNNFNETIGGATALTMAGGQVTTGANGTLTVAGNITTFGSGLGSTANTSTITGNLSLGNTTRTFNYRPTPKMTLTSSLNASEYNDQLTYTFVATGDPTDPTPTGQVSFFDGTTQIGQTLTLGDPVQGFNPGTAFVKTSTLGAGQHTITAVYTGDNYYAPTSIILGQPQVVVNAPEITTLSSSSGAVQPGQNVTYTFNLNAPTGSIAPTGMVTFFDTLLVGGVAGPRTQIGTTQALSAAGTVSVSTNYDTSQVGVHVIEAQYTGDNYYSSSDVTLSPGQLVGYPPLVQISTTPGSAGNQTADAVTARHEVKYSIKVSGDIGQPNPTGTVTVFADAGGMGGPITVGTGTLDASGSTTVTTSGGFDIGSYKITAVYSGDVTSPTNPFYTNATATLPAAQVARTPVVYQLSASNDPGTTSDVTTSPPVPPSTISVTFNANSNPNVLTSNSVQPTGNVVFTFTGALTTSVQTATLNNGSATVKFDDSATPGDYTITAVYGGDANYAKHTEMITEGLLDHSFSNVPQRLVASANTVLISKNVKLTYTANNGTTPGTGSVVFYSDGIQIGTATLGMGGSAQINVPTGIMTPGLGVGTHVIQAVFTTGDSNYNSETRTLDPNLVVVAPFDAVLSTNADPAQLASPITFTFSSAVETGAPAASGTVTFFDGTNIIGTASLPTAGPNAGIASITYSSLSEGSHNISAVYSGDANYQVFTANLAAVQVVGPPPFITINSSLDPSQTGGAVTFNVSVTSPVGGIFQPTGTVKLFSDGNAISNNLTLKNGQASFTTSGLGSGAHNITAVYSGDVHYTTEIATMTLNQVVIDPLLVQLTSTLNPVFSATPTQNTTFPVLQSTAVTFTLKVPRTSGGDPTPQGSVKFEEFDANGNFLRSISTTNLSGGLASSTGYISPAATGTYLIKATFTPTAGNLNYEPISETIVETVVSALPTSPPPTVTQRFEPQLTVNGVISGPGAGLTALGAGILTLNGVNTYTGTTTIQGTALGAVGTVIAGVNNAVPNVPLVLNASGLLDLNGKTETVASLRGPAASNPGSVNLNGGALTVGTDGTSTTYAGTIVSGTTPANSSANTLTKTGAGTLTLNRSSPNYLGTLNVQMGTVLVNGNDGNATVHVFTGSTLGGTNGTVGTVAVDSGGNVAPGNGPGILNSGPVTFASGSNFTVELNGTTVGTQYDRLAVTGTATLNGVKLVASLGYVATVGDSYVILTSTTLVGQLSDLSGNLIAEGGRYVTNSRVFTVSYVGNQVTLTFAGFDAVGALNSTANPADPSQPITFNISYASGAGVPTGTVTFYKNSVSLANQLGATKNLVNGGASSDAIANLPIGSTTIIAVLNSNNNFTASNATLTQVVNVATSTSIVSSTSRAIFGDSITFTATVTGTGGVPTGYVTFYNLASGQTLGSAGLSGGVAQLTTALSSVGQATIQAVYSGNSNFRTSNAALVQAIAPVPLLAVGSAAGGNGLVSVYDPRTGALLAQGAPFGAYSGAIKVATGDVNGDGYSDLVILAGPSTSGVNLNGTVLIVSGRDFSVLASYVIPYGGEMNLAVGDVDGDGKADVIVSTATALDYVAVFSSYTQNVIATYEVFGGLSLGVTLATGDFDGDGRTDIIAGTATQLGAAVVISGRTGQQLAVVALPVPANGVNVAVGDVNGDGKADIIFGFANDIPAVVVYDGATQSLRGSFLAFPGQPFGVRVSTVDRDGDGLADIVTTFNGPSSLGLYYDGLSFTLIDGFFQLAPPSPSGLYVGGSI